VSGAERYNVSFITSELTQLSPSGFLYFFFHRRGASNELRRDLGGVLVVPLRPGLQACTLSSSFRLHLAQYSISMATNHNYEISSMVRFDWIPSRISRWARWLGTPNALLLPPH